MTRYIDADAVKDCVEKEVYTHDYIEHVYQIIDEAPTADVVEVVRCGECKKQFTNNCYMIYGKNMMRNLFNNDFCSYGERKEKSEVEE